jgi:hypothetical protein
MLPSDREAALRKGHSPSAGIATDVIDGPVQGCLTADSLELQCALLGNQKTIGCWLEQYRASIGTTDHDLIFDAAEMMLAAETDSGQNAVRSELDSFRISHSAPAHPTPM